MTDNEKLALITYNQPFNPAVPISSDGLSQGDKQHLIWQYPGILWSFWSVPIFDNSVSWQNRPDSNSITWQNRSDSNSITWRNV